MSKRVPLSERKRNSPKGVDAVIQPTEKESLETQEKAVEKVTLYIRPEQVVALEQIQLAERQRTGKKPKKSELVQEALDLLIEKYT